MTKALVISTKRSAWRDLMRSLDYARDDKTTLEMTKEKGILARAAPFL